MDQDSIDTLEFVHRLLLVDNSVKVIRILVEVTGGSEKWHHLGDIIWFSKADSEDDKEPKSVRCEVEFITDRYDFLKESKLGKKSVKITSYFLTEKAPDHTFNGYTWYRPNPFDKHDKGEVIH
ncbi:MAG: hypothetical protein LH609_21590 [Rudanella sp.]|nr:hypothetical protein [Rudanella sp.]